METTTFSLGEQIGEIAKQNLLAPLLVCLLLALPLALLSRFNNGPPSLFDPLPFVYNTTQFITNNAKFMRRATNALKNASLAKFYLGPTPVYLVSGPENIQTFFRRSHKIGNEDIFVHNALPVLYKMTKDEIKRFADDKSGRGVRPAPGTESVPIKQRYWHGYEHVHSEYLARPQHMKPVVDIFGSLMTKVFEDYTIGEWTTLSLNQFFRREVTECAMTALLGPTIFEMNPGFLDAFWRYDDKVFTLTLGFPKWLNPEPYRIQDQYLAMVEKYLDAAWAEFDWDGPSEETPWEPLFGARVCREIAKWLRDTGFHDQVAAGALGTLIFAQNSNTIPSATWMAIEVIRDPSLFLALREEVATAYVINPETGTRALDGQKLANLPLLHSVFIETLRLHMNFSIIRNVKEPVSMAGYTIGKGAMLQAPMPVAHCDEAVWGLQGHPASEFWAERHVKYQEGVDEFGQPCKTRVFSMAGRPSSFFPFGGGEFICPGRHLAKNEIFTMIALLVSRFDVKFTQWTAAGGLPSDRPAENDSRYSGAGAMHPDRDMQIQWKRIW